VKFLIDHNLSPTLALERSKARRVLIPNEAALHAHLNGGVSAGPGVGAILRGLTHVV